MFSLQKRYAGFIHGANFLIDVDGILTKVGFYTTRYAKADDPRSAELDMVQQIRDDLRESVRNPCNDSPTVYLESIAEIGWIDYFRKHGRGLAFYFEDGSNMTSE